jgi:tRNA modification GTPase
MDESETIAAISTPPGRGGVAVVRVSGPAAFAVAARLTGRHVDASLAGRFFHSAFFNVNELLDDGLVLIFAAPHSYTGEDVVEFQCHGGSVAPRRVLEACLAAGARLARRGEFTQRAFLNGRLDLSAAEAVIDLIDAKTDRAADDAVARLGGAASAEFEALYTAALDISVRLEHALDFSEDELPGDFADNLARDLSSLRSRIAARLATAREGRLLREGALVVLAGPPNVGKSSLLNALLGERRAIVSDTAGTTRDFIEESVEIGGWPVRLVDTAGLRAAGDVIEAEGVGRAEELIAKADLVLSLEESGNGGTKTTRTPKTPRMSGAIHVLSKCDLHPADQATHSLPVSALTGEGLPELRAAIADRLEKLAAKGEEASGADVTTRQKELLQIAADALARVDVGDLVVAANEARVAAESLGKILGKVYTEDLLESIFSRFCVGK